MSIRDSTIAPEYEVGQVVERFDISPGPANRYVVQSILPPGVLYQGRTSRHPEAWHVTCAREDNRRMSIWGTPVWLACRVRPLSGDTNPPCVPKTNHKIGVPKNKLP